MGLDDRSKNAFTPGVTPMITVRAIQHAAALLTGLVIVFGGPATAQVADTAAEAQVVDDGPMMWPVVADPNTNPVVFAVRQQLGEKNGTKGYHPKDVAALTTFYNARSEGPVWIGDNGLTPRALAAKAELQKADHWGLEAKHYKLSIIPAVGATDLARATAELEFAFAVLKYARHARAGRVKPSSVTRINDFPAPQKDVATVLDELVQSADVGASLRGLHPAHPEFERLRQALLKARGISTIETGALPTEAKTKAQDIVKIELPKGDDITLGMQHGDVALLRQRLEVPADVGANPHYFDAPLAQAVQDFQIDAGLVATGDLDGETRKRLNAKLLPAETRAERSDELADADGTQDGVNKPNSQKIQLILNNMERWRWLPEDLGDLYVWNNVPEFRARVFRGEKTVFSEKIIVGLPEWATPSFMADMKYIIFHPSWGVPRGIKLKELLPRLKRAQPQSLFDFFGGGGGTGAVFKAYNLEVYRNGQKVNPNGIKWNSSNILNYSFVQPAGKKNPLGVVKFRFPNKHNVYMHDTIERELFAKSRRAYSHGCIRVRDPIKLAAVLLEQDQSMSPASTRRKARSGGSVTLQSRVPVYVTYMTARVDEDGKLHTYGDLYGRDSRLARQMGRSMRFDEPKVAKPKSSSPRKRSARKKRKKKKKSASSGNSFPSSMSQAISGRYN